MKLVSALVKGDHSGITMFVFHSAESEFGNTMFRIWSFIGPSPISTKPFPLPLERSFAKDVPTMPGILFTQTKFLVSLERPQLPRYTGLVLIHNDFFNTILWRHWMTTTSICWLLLEKRLLSTVMSGWFVCQASNNELNWIFGFHSLIKRHLVIVIEGELSASLN